MGLKIEVRIKQIFFLVVFALVSACGQEGEPLVVYAGKGLKLAMEESKQVFEKRENIQVSIVYAGSDTLLATLQKSLKGDIFIPGSESYLQKAGDLVARSYYVAQHTPAFAILTEAEGRLKSYSDLLQPGVRIAVGNKNMCAIGRISELMMSDADPADSFRHNIVITASTVNELLQLVADGEVDAALVWNDMLLWDVGKPLTRIPIPNAINRPKEIRVGVLTTSIAPENATLFAEFMANEGKQIFAKHGFGGS